MNGSSPGLQMMNLRLRDESSVPASFPNAGLAFPLTRLQKVRIHLFIHFSVQGYDFTSMSDTQIFLGCSTILVPYLRQRFQHHMIVNYWSEQDEVSGCCLSRSSIYSNKPATCRQGDWKLKVWDAFNRLDALWLFIKVLNFVTFLYYGVYPCISLVSLEYSESFFLFLDNSMKLVGRGRYRNIPERLMKVRAVYVRPQRTRFISYDLLNQQLMWFTITVRSNNVTIIFFTFSWFSDLFFD
jgi:hypothetical protein